MRSSLTSLTIVDCLFADSSSLSAKQKPKRLFAQSLNRFISETILEKIGDYAEQAGINRGIAQAVSDQFIKDTAKKGKAYLGQRKHSTSSVTSETSYDGHQHSEKLNMDNKENYNDQQHQRNQNQQQQYQQRPQQLINSHHSADDVEEPMVQQKVQLRPGYGGR
ncbi:unnamed protein product [Anisakis simplex]|uniref:Uncharacterized protein n=1 Tax=Anisakis simplex TaxID=6269 RepID=A0A0M3JU53_ANISI|nr:unnamed protein product [Anisakis simplex]